MTNRIPDLVYGPDDGGKPVVLVDGTQLQSSLAELLAAVPALRAPEHALALMQAINHFRGDFAYEVIDDPAAFEQEYRRRRGAQDAAAGFRVGAPRLADFGWPDFAAIHAPVWRDGALHACLRDLSVGLAYRCRLVDPLARPDYEPLPLGPAAAADASG